MRSLKIWLCAILIGLPAGTAAQEFRLEEVDSPARLAVSDLQPGTIYFTDHRNDELRDPSLGLIPFEEWSRSRPLEKQILSPYPEYVEPTVDVTTHGITKRHTEKLHMFVAEARFLIDKAPGTLDLARYLNLDFIKGIDPAIEHRLVGPEEARPRTDPEFEYTRHPQRNWCEDGPTTLCIESRYKLEGKLPIGVRLANKLEEGRKISEFIEFQSELRLLPPNELGEYPDLARLTGLDSPVVGAIEQTIFYVNQVMQFGKLLAVFQHDPTDPSRTIVTAYMALGVETDVLETKRGFESIPVLRNLIPSQVLMGNSSFNEGKSISAGLPSYARNQVKAIAGLLNQG